MADQKLNEVTKVTDMSYVPVIMSDGSIGQIAKADLATVVAELMNSSRLFPFMYRGECYDGNDAIFNGFYDVASSSVRPNTPAAYGLLIVVYQRYPVQVFISHLGKLFIRANSNNTWTDWVEK